MAVSEHDLLAALATVQDPHTGKDFVSTKALHKLTISGGDVAFEVELGYPAKSLVPVLRTQLVAAARGVAGVGNVSVNITSKISAHSVQRGVQLLPQVKNIIAVASGKGGVGKSTVSVNLASTLQQMGKKVGLMDADIYGPSIGKMLGLGGRQQMDVKNDRITPIEKYGLKLMSFSFLVDDNQPVVWRGPMLGKAMEQFLYDMDWGELDYLIIDLPPGTGDTQLSLAQLVQTDGAIIVTTPQSVALLDAGRAVAMFEQVNIRILGVVENMSEFICSHCGKPSHIFSRGGGSRLAASSSSVLLGQVPLVEDCMAAAEKGEIPVYKNKNKNIKPVADAFEHIARNIASVLETQ